MSERTTLTGAGWTQIGTGPATVQLISTGASVMVACSTSAPATNSDGLILVDQGDNHTFQLTNAIWGQVVNPNASAIVAVQPE